MKIELFQVQGCGNCSAARDELRAVAERSAPGATWREVDPVKELDYAVQLGVISLPAVAVDGQLVFSSLPTASQLENELRRRVEGSTYGR